MDELLERNTPDERRNMDLVKEYMIIVYDPKLASARAVAHLCAPNNRFIAPTTFPDIHTLEEYADGHARLMRQVNDLHFVSFDVLFARGNRVCLRYTSEGSHRDEPHGKLKATGKKARWTANGLFLLEGGKLVEFVKEWNKLAMWEQLGWPVDECLSAKKRRKAAVR